MIAFVLADAFLEKFGGDAVAHIRVGYDAFMKEVKRAT
jgi:hypothetical protein